MIDTILNILLKKKDEREELIVLLVGVLLTCMVTSRLYTILLGPYVVMWPPEVDRLVGFALGGRLLVVVVVFLFAWIFFYGFVPYLLVGPTNCLSHKLYSFVKGRVLKMITERTSRPARWAADVFADLGFIKIANNEIQPGVLVLDFARLVKQAYEAKDALGLHPSLKSSYSIVILQFLVVYFWLILPDFHPGFFISLVVVVSSSVLFVARTILLLFGLSVYFHRDEVVSLLEYEPNTT
jgi:hypothetical protein